LSIGAATHGHNADAISLTQVHILAIGDAWQAHTAGLLIYQVTASALDAASNLVALFDVALINVGSADQTLFGVALQHTALSQATLDDRQVVVMVLADGIYG
jgi:hypothetical protein